MIQQNSDHISILEDDAIFNNLLKPKITDILSDFEITINKIYEYMMENITPAIEISFKNFELLKKKVLKLYKKYAGDQNDKMHNFYEEIKFLEGENVSTFNINIIEQVNNINKHINYHLFGKHKYNKKFSQKLKKFANKLVTGIKGGLGFINPKAEKIVSKVVDPLILKPEEEPEEKENEEEEQEEKEENEKEEENLKKEEKKEEDDDADKIFNNIDFTTKEVDQNLNFGNIVKQKFIKNSELKKEQIISNYRYEKEKNNRKIEKDEFSGRIKIAYIEQDIETFYERLIDENIVKLTEYAENEFIPGFQYINKGKLEEFQNLISENKVQIKTANLITKMVAYLEIMLNRILDTFI